MKVLKYLIVGFVILFVLAKFVLPVALAIVSYVVGLIFSVIGSLLGIVFVVGLPIALVLGVIYLCKNHKTILK